jgi:hypothetical protein
MPYDESQPEPLTELDTNNHTKFYGNDEDADFDGTFRHDGTATYEQHYSRLALLNSGLYNGKWGDNEQRRKNDNLAVFDAVASQLELTNYQKTVGRRAFSELNLRDLSSPDGIDTTLVAIITAAIVVRADGRFYHPNRDINNNDIPFVRLLDSLDYRESVIHSAYQKVLDRVNL